MNEDSRFSRHIGLFGAAGQGRIAQSDVTVVGASGLGTPTAQYLALLGPRSITIVEPGTLKGSNRNRNVAARASDEPGVALKVEIAARMVRELAPRTTVHVVADRLESEAAFEAFASSSHVFGCLDQDGARFVLNEACLAFGSVLIDMASDVQPNGEEFGGRVSVVQTSAGCLVCRGLLDMTDVRRYLSSEIEQENEASAYGVPVDALLPGTGPSVATINGIVAGLGVTEFWASVTEIRDANLDIFYRGREGAIRKSVDLPAPNCYYCETVAGTGWDSRIATDVASARIRKA